MMILGSTGAAYFEPHLFVGAVLPFVIGFILGNLDPELRDFFTPAGTMMIPFFAFALGNTIDLTVILKTGLLGILLGLGVIIITGIPSSLLTASLAAAMALLAWPLRVQPVLPLRIR